MQSFLLVLGSYLPSCVVLFNNILLSDVQNRCQALRSIFFFYEDRAVKGIGYVGVLHSNLPKPEELDC
jgi:hypothetical protein